MVISYNSLSAEEEFFTWRQGDTGEVMHFAVTRFNTYLTALPFPVRPIALTKELVLHLAARNGVEPEHLERLPPSRLDDPCLLIESTNDTHMVVDGSHRIIKRFMLGEQVAPAWLVPGRIWRRFLIEGVPGRDCDWSDYLEHQNPLA